MTQQQYRSQEPNERIKCCKRPISCGLSKTSPGVRNGSMYAGLKIEPKLLLGGLLAGGGGEGEGGSCLNGMANSYEKISS